MDKNPSGAFSFQKQIRSKGFIKMFSLAQSVGRNGKNQKTDVRQIETLLGRLGHLDLNRTDGSTGYFGVRLEDAVKDFQIEKN
jgi:hypothetical protein